MSDTIRESLGAIAVSAMLAACASGTGPRDARTVAWWRTTEALSGDAMEGRDTGSPGYDRAAAMVAERFRQAGLAPAGDDGGYFQSIALHEIEASADGTAIAVAFGDGRRHALRFLHEITVAPDFGLAAELDAPLTFRGYCRPSDLTDARGAVVACFGARRKGLPNGSERIAAAIAAGAVGVVSVDDPGFTAEPPRWPVAYARTVSVDAKPVRPEAITLFRVGAAAFAGLAGESGQDGADLIARGARGDPLPAFDFKARFTAHLALRERSYRSANVLAKLPGTDPALANEPVLLIAHLDGYGYGTEVDGDRLYNGALDDAAYVATLLTLADERRGKGFRRPLLFAAVTGEEKGLLGSTWLAQHPTAAAPRPVAVLNLDQLRPLYPLKILTTLALADSTLGRSVREVAEPMGIRVREDLEPERGLLRRTDHWPFMQVGVPAVSFLFGFDADDAVARARYRDWYERRYHAPQDDLSTPIDYQAQADFHRFYFALVEKVADADAAPAWSTDSPYRPKTPGGS